MCVWGGGGGVKVVDSCKMEKVGEVLTPFIFKKRLKSYF